MKDYRDLLKVHSAKLRPVLGGYRGLSKACGFGSPNFIKLLEDKQRHTTPDGIARIINGLGIEGDDKVLLLEQFLAYYNKPVIAIKSLLEEAEQVVSVPFSNPMY